MHDKRSNKLQACPIWWVWWVSLLFCAVDDTLTPNALGQGSHSDSLRVQSQTPDWVSGHLVQFNDNGAWSWFMDERAVVDTQEGKLVVGSDASRAGVGGPTRNGAIEAVIYNFASGVRERSVLLPRGGHRFGADDHDAPAFLIRPDGKYLAAYAGHNNDNFSYWRIYSSGAWGPEQAFDWNSIPGGTDNPTTYSNLRYLSAENRLYNFVRCNDQRSPNIKISTDFGDTFSFGGQLVGPDGQVGYNSGYFRYADNGVDRIDFTCTEAHPRDWLTSIYHGYISNGMSFKTDGTLVDRDIFDQSCPVSSDFQVVFTNGTVMPPGQTNYRCWNSDLQRYPDGTIQCIIHARINQSASGGYPDRVDPNHAFFFCRYDGSDWRTTYLCQAGQKMYPAEADYVGLGTLHPADPNSIYLSTRYDPRMVTAGVFDTNQPASSAHEIWKGVTTNHGASFTWIPITRNSLRGNFRPHIPAWDSTHTALLWFRGIYYSAQRFDTALVGLIERAGESVGLMSYVDATTANTSLADGDPITPTGPDANPGPADDQWHLRTGFGNGGSVFASSETGDGEDPPTLRTSVKGLTNGTYDIWVNFWADPKADWRIRAGFSKANMEIFRQMASQGVAPGNHKPAITVANAGPIFLYQAYVGRTTGTSFEVFVDDEAIQTGTADRMVGDTTRTWYDGLSFAPVHSTDLHSRRGWSPP